MLGTAAAIGLKADPGLGAGHAGVWLPALQAVLFVEQKRQHGCVSGVEPGLIRTDHLTPKRGKRCVADSQILNRPDGTAHWSAGLE
ncbi:MAG: hypothetical protein ACI8P0_004395 [Planctomycetaceae bacterium]|jgi:hypothetical protein